MRSLSQATPEKVGNGFGVREEVYSEKILRGANKDR
jgi:hypothetical protein